MKTFKEHMHNHDIPVEDGVKNIADLADPETLKMVNAFVGSIADKDWLSPGQAIGEMRQKLSRIGITFPAVELGEGEGEGSVPLTQWGGRYGKDGNQAPDEVIADDGITHRVDGGLSLNYKFSELDNGSTRVLAKIA